MTKDDFLRDLMRERGRVQSAAKKDAARLRIAKQMQDLPECHCGKPDGRHLKTCLRLMEWKRIFGKA